MTTADIFGTMGAVTWTQECARAVLILVYGIVALRLAGRRIFGKWSALDIVMSFVVGSNLSRALTGNAPLAGTLAATTLLFVLHWLLSQAVARSKALSKLLEGETVRLGADGRIDRVLLMRHAVSEADLNEALRAAGLTSPAAAQLVFLEPSGKISVFKADRAGAAAS